MKMVEEDLICFMMSIGKDLNVLFVSEVTSFSGEQEDLPLLWLTESGDERELDLMLICYARNEDHAAEIAIEERKKYDETGMIGEWVVLKGGK